MNSNGKNTHLPNQERAKVKLCDYANRQLCDSRKYNFGTNSVSEMMAKEASYEACAILLSCQLRLFKVTCNLLSGKSTVLWNKKQRSFISQTKMQKEIINLFEDLISISLFDSTLCC